MSVDWNQKFNDFLFDKKFIIIKKFTLKNKLQLDTSKLKLYQTDTQKWQNIEKFDLVISPNFCDTNTN